MGAQSNNKGVENVDAELPDLAPSVRLRQTPDEKRDVMEGQDYLQVGWTRVVIAFVIVSSLCAGLLLMPSLPPRSIVMTTDPEGSAYAEVGPRYREVLGRAGMGMARY